MNHGWQCHCSLTIIIHIHVFVEEILIACQHYLVLVFVGVCDNLWRRQWHPTPVLLPGKSHGERSLVGCSPRGCKELDTMEELSMHAWRSIGGFSRGKAQFMLHFVKDRLADL